MAPLTVDVDEGQLARVDERGEPSLHPGPRSGAAQQPLIERGRRGRAVRAEVGRDDDGRGGVGIGQPAPARQPRRGAGEGDPAGVRIGRRGAVAEHALPGQRLEQGTPAGAEALAQRVGPGPVPDPVHDRRDELGAGEHGAVEHGGGRLGQQVHLLDGRERALPRRLLPGPGGGEQAEIGTHLVGREEVEGAALRPGAHECPLGEGVRDGPGRRAADRDGLLGAGGDLGLHAAEAAGDRHGVAAGAEIEVAGHPPRPYLVAGERRDHACASRLRWVLRWARTLARVPQRCIEHHRRLPGREVSSSSNPQSGAAHTRTRSRSGPPKSSTPSRARVASACAAVGGDDRRPPAVEGGDERRHRREPVQGGDVRRIGGERPSTAANAIRVTAVRSSRNGATSVVHDGDLQFRQVQHHRQVAGQVRRSVDDLPVRGVLGGAAAVHEIEARPAAAPSAVVGVADHVTTLTGYMALRCQCPSVYAASGSISRNAKLSSR